MRYIRQETLPQIGKSGQELLAKKTVAIVGLGALGSVSSNLLARAGINKLILIDNDKVSLNNLQRQILYNEDDINKQKVEVAKNKLTKINSDIEIESHNIYLTKKNITLIKDADLILDCTDNFKTRRLLSNFSKQNNTIWIHAAATGIIGNVLVIDNKDFCFECIYEKIKPQGNCESEGILNTLITIISSIQVTQAIKILTKQEYSKKLIHYNAWTNELLSITVNKNPQCDCKIKTEKKQELFTITKCKTKAAYSAKINKKLNLKKIQENFNTIVNTPILLILKEDNHEIIVHNYGELLFKDLTDEKIIKEISNKIFKVGLK